MKQSEVRRVPPIRPARDVALRHRRRETSRVPDDPVRQQPAAAPAGDTEFLLVDKPALDRFIHADHEVFEIVAGIMILDHVAELLAVTRAPARVRIKHDVTLRRHPLKLVVENESVGRVRTAVNVQDERIFFRLVEPGRPLQPRLDHFAVETFVTNFFRLGQVELPEKFVVAVGQLARLAARAIEPEQVADPRRSRRDVDEF